MNESQGASRNGHGQHRRGACVGHGMLMKIVSKIVSMIVRYGTQVV